MPKVAIHTLTWAVKNSWYELRTPGSLDQHTWLAENEQWFQWLTDHSSFSFQGRSGHLTLLKESRGGEHYWYAYRTQHRQTAKKYAGRTADLTFARLETIAETLTTQSHPALEMPARIKQELWPHMPLLVPKLHVPRPHGTLISREHLLSRLDAGVLRPLTLLAAPAGFGKTTLVSQWAVRRMAGNTGAEPLSIGWVSLDAGDNDPARFWAYVIAALRDSGFSVGEAAEALLHSPHLSLLAGALTALINELMALSRATVLILDDYHLMSEPAIHESVQFLLDHLPPRLHLLLAGRADPPLALARLRARDQLVEIREPDLRLSGEEAASFLTQVMGLTLSGEDMHLLETRTEGWIAGLQLAALTMRRYADVSAFIRSFAGSHRLILDYVQEEILDPLPERQQRFLLHMSVLERMNAGVCQALTGEQASQQMLESLERTNLFLVPLDEERRWYRFHTLFREVLLARLQATEPEQVLRLHREAALWYQQQGWLHEAISHALATQDYSFVADLLEGYVERLYLQGEIKTLLAWIKLLPAEVVRAHPRLATSYILAFNMLSPFSDQEQKAYLAHLRAGVEQAVQREVQAGLSLAEREQLRHRLTILDGWELGARALADGNVEQMSKLAEQIQHMELTDDNMWQLQREGSLAMAYRLAGNFPPMVAALQESQRRTWMVQQRYQEIQTLWGMITAYIGLGQLRQASDRCQELQRLVDRLGGPLPVAAYPDVFQAQLAYEWNQMEVAKSAAEAAIEKTAPLQYMDILIWAYEVLGRVCMAQGDLTGAEHVVREMERVNQSAGIPLFRPWIEHLRVHLWLAQGDLTRAVDWAEHTSYRESALFYSSEIASLTLVRVYLAQSRYPQALQLLTALLSSAEQVARVGSIISILALHVSALQASGATQETLHVLHRLLTLTEPEGHIRVFLDAGEPMHRALQTWLTAEQHTASPVLVSYTHTLLDAFASNQRQVAAEKTIPFASPSLSHTPSHSIPPLPEPLTPREQEVLRLLAEGASNQEIANRLVVSLTTVKKHVGSLLLKLAAENRTHAVARAREFSLL